MTASSRLLQHTSTSTAGAGTKPNSISSSQFLDHFQRAWNAPQGRKPLQSWQPRDRKGRKDKKGSLAIPRRLGLAVSGGADSMALAYLCKQLAYSQDLTVTGFVVDHKAREESGREARTVAGWLKRIGIKPQILELDWAQDNNNSSSPSSKVTAFETHARRLRFQALGTACRDNQIEALLMGHHRDDNVETTLWRLCSGARGAGLTGIPRIARIPECHGLYGVSESGSSLVLRTLDATTSTTNDRDFTIHLPGNKASSTTVLSTGGILICRPLLSFPKSSLLATCQEHGIPFVTDPTNFDPTLTPRNAIRSLLSTATTTTTAAAGTTAYAVDSATGENSKVPRALQTPSILSLIESKQNLLKETMDFSDDLLRRCKLLSLNLGSGVMVLQFPGPGSEMTDTETDSEETTHSDAKRRNKTRIRQAQIQAFTLRRITELVSPFPENHFPLRSFEGFTDRVFPVVFSGSSSMGRMQGNKRKQNRQAFTLGGVMFRPVESNEDDNGNNNSTTTNYNNQTWLLSRQPFMRNRLPIQRFDVEVPSSLDNTPATAAAVGKDNTTNTNANSNNNTIFSHPKYTPWKLWDNRYWFRIAIVPSDADTATSSSSFSIAPVDVIEGTSQHKNRNKRTQKTLPLLIRPFQKSDLKPISGSFSDSKSKQSPLFPRHEKGEEQGQNKFDKNVSLLTSVEFKKFLSRQAPGHVRFTMPLITTAGGSISDPGFLSEPKFKSAVGNNNKDVPLALPTMHFPLPSCHSQSLLPSPYKIQWEWMYKMVDTEVLGLLSWSNNE